MECARKGCHCPVGKASYEHDGKTYCCEKCARVCTDGHCVCTAADCGRG